MFYEVIATLGDLGAIGIAATIISVTMLFVVADIIRHLRKDDSQLSTPATRFAVAVTGPMSPCALLSKLFGRA